MWWQVSRRLPALCLAALVLGLSACGWHLRGFDQGAVSLEGIAVAVQSQLGPGPLSREVTAGLQSAGADVVAPAPGVPTLVLLGERHETRNISGNLRADLQEFELRYQAEWELRGGEGETLVERTTFEQIRSFRFEQDQVLGSERREDAVVRELRRDFAALLRARIQALLGTAK